MDGLGRVADADPRDPQLRVLKGQLTEGEVAEVAVVDDRVHDGRVGPALLNKLGLNSRIEIARWLASTRSTEPVKPAA